MLLTITISIVLFILFFIAPFYVEDKFKSRREKKKADPEKTNKN